MTKPLSETTLPVRVAQIAFAVLLATKIYLAATAPPVGDEAYYWMWGQKLGWSYLDHPPLHAWLLRLVSMVFGWNLFSLRSLTWVTLGGTLWIFWLWAKRLQPENPGAWFWPSAAIYLATPLFYIMSGISFHDHLLIFLCIAAGHLFLVFAEKWEASGKGFAWLYAAAAVLGLAVLTKYNGVLVGIGVAVFFVAHRPLRPLWRSPHLYLAALLAVAIQAPVIYWNLTEGLASYKFHLSERWGGDLFVFHPIFFLEFVGGTLLVVGPLLLVPIVSIIRRPFGTAFADRARTLALSVGAISTLAMGFLSFFVPIFFYWNITAIILLMPLLAGRIRWRWVLYAHLIYGLVLAVTFASHATLLPAGDWTIASTYGWPETAARVEALEKVEPIRFIATTRYTTAAQLGFAMHDPDVTAIADRHDQYDYWFDPAAHEGQNALVISDPTLGIAEIASHFDRLTELERVPYLLHGVTIYTPIIYLGEGYHAAAH
jgi:4-amino-4-deoxy-L-arabinose transferase-like glycosyltransferase